MKIRKTICFVSVIAFAFLFSTGCTVAPRLSKTGPNLDIPNPTIYQPQAQAQATDKKK